MVVLVWARPHFLNVANIVLVHKQIHVCFSVTTTTFAMPPYFTMENLLSFLPLQKSLALFVQCQFVFQLFAMSLL